MYSKSHAAISAAIGLAVALWFDLALTRAAFFVGYAAVVGTAIDLDHFAIARLRTGDWSNLRFVLSNPRATVVDQDRIFGEGDVGARTRLVSHVVVGAVLVAAVAVVAPTLASVTGVVLAAHVACDVAYDARRSRGERGAQSE